MTMKSNKEEILGALPMMVEDNSLGEDIRKRLAGLPPITDLSKYPTIEPQEVFMHRMRLDHLLSKYQLSEKSIHSGGDCQFEAVADQLYRNRNANVTFYVRNAAVYQFRTFPERYAALVDAEGCRNYVEYVDRISQRGEWGDKATLQAMSDFFGCVIFVLSTTCYTAVLQFTPGHITCSKEVWLCHQAVYHYYSIYPKGRIADVDLTVAQGHLKDFANLTVYSDKFDLLRLKATREGFVVEFLAICEEMEKDEKFPAEHQFLSIMKKTKTLMEKPVERALEDLKFFAESMVREFQLTVKVLELDIKTRELTMEKTRQERHVNRLRSLQKCGTFTDYTIILEEAPKDGDDEFMTSIESRSRIEFKVHKAVLSEYIPRFSKDVFQLMKEREELVIAHEYDFQPMDKETVECVIAFMYTGQLPDPKERLPSVLALATYLQIEELVRMCCELMSSNIDDDNCLPIWQWAITHLSDGPHWKSLHEACGTFMEKNLQMENPPTGTTWPATTPPKSPSREIGKTRFLRKRKIGRTAKVKSEASPVAAKTEDTVLPFQFQVTPEVTASSINCNNEEGITNSLQFGNLKL